MYEGTPYVSNVFTGVIAGQAEMAGSKLAVAIAFNSFIGVDYLTLQFAYGDALVHAYAGLLYNRSCGDNGVRAAGDGSLALSGIADTTFNASIHLVYYGACSTNDLVWVLSGTASIDSILFYERCLLLYFAAFILNLTSLCNHPWPAIIV